MTNASRRKTGGSALFDCLASAQRRAVLRVLLSAGDSLSIRELAVRTAATLDGTVPEAVTDDERERIHGLLHHRDLPKLASVDLVDRHRDDGRVETGTNPVLDESGFRDAVEPRPSEDGDALFEALADDRRRHVLGVIRDADRALVLREVARRVAARERGRPVADVPDGDVERIRDDLWHGDLPKLRAAGVVEYDPGVDMVAFDDHSLLHEPWVDLTTGRRVARA